MIKTFINMQEQHKDKQQTLRLSCQIVSWFDGADATEQTKEHQSEMFIQKHQLMKSFQIKTEAVL